jgi:ferrous iron transport protein B
MKIALFGNPNTGKSSVFNLLTGLRQQVGNFAGVTVEKREGFLTIGKAQYTITDFPGAYSVYPRSKDEKIVYDVLTNKNREIYLDAILFVVDAANLERNLLFFTQVYDLNIPLILVLNMWDLTAKRGIEINIEKLKEAFPGVQIVTSNARLGMGKARITEAIQNIDLTTRKSFFFEDYQVADINDQEKQIAETNLRYDKIRKLLEVAEKVKETKTDVFSRKIDKIVVHPIWGYAIFLVVLLTIFQFIFSFANIPMELIDGIFTDFAAYTSQILPAGVFNNLICHGIIPGIGGIVVFIPQIALLFFFIAILEETGYLARVVFIMDRLMRPFGLNGKSVVPLMSSVACAIPAVMATRTISNWKERMITIFVAPFMSCSARIPVYTLLISLVIPKIYYFGFINLQGIVLFSLYSLGLIAVLVVSYIMKFIVKSEEKGFLLLELPSYKNPRWPNIGISILEKIKLFIFDAGKVILAISIILWALASYGPNNSMDEALEKTKKLKQFSLLSKVDKDRELASAKLEASYIGRMGKFIEPAIEPLGYDWKIGISLITSFAAREVFVGSLATIYAVQDDGATKTRLIQRLKRDKNAKGEKTYTVASGVSLMIFYVFAMQCMSTLAVVKRETNSWKWPIIQLIVMGVMAYFAAFIAFQLLR